MQQSKISKSVKNILRGSKRNRCLRCDVVEANDDKTETKSPALPPNENTLSGTETTNGNPEKMEHEKGDDDDREQADPKKTSEASANKLEMFQEKQKFIEEQNRKRKEMLSKVNLKLE